MSKHTPGPWKAVGDKIYSADRRQVAHVYALVHPKDLNVMQSIPNARLLAAAPELLEFVKELFWYCDTGDSGFLKTYDEAMKLIAKIEDNA